MSYFSIFLKIPESMTLSVLFCFILILFSSTFSAIRLVLPLSCPKSYSYFLKRFSSPDRLSKLLLSRFDAYCSFSFSKTFLRCPMMVSSSTCIPQYLHSYASRFRVSWPRLWHFASRLRFFSWWRAELMHQFLTICSEWWYFYYFLLEDWEAVGILLKDWLLFLPGWFSEHFRNL